MGTPREEYEFCRKEIIRKYGERGFYEKLKEFYDLARELRAEITYCKEIDMPMFLKVRFEPLLCWREDQLLGDLIREQLEKQKEPVE